MSMFDFIRELFDDPLLGIWSILAVPYCSVLFLITLPDPISYFYLFLALMTIGWIAAYPTIFRRASQSSFDWNEDPDMTGISGWTIVGLTGIMLISFLMAFYRHGSILQFWKNPALWVPQNLYPLSVEQTTQSKGLYNFMIDLFSTWFAVVPGEESLKCLFSVLYRTYENTDVADAPFALQPFYLIGNLAWSIEHIIIGQNPFYFGFNVFACGELMGAASAQSGSYLTSWIIHGIFNSMILLASFLAGGYIRITVG